MCLANYYVKFIIIPKAAFIIIIVVNMVIIEIASIIIMKDHSINFA